MQPVLISPPAPTIPPLLPIPPIPPKQLVPSVIHQQQLISNAENIRSDSIAIAAVAVSQAQKDLREGIHKKLNAQSPEGNDQTDDNQGPLSSVSTPIENGKPYIVITGLKAGLDSSIDQYVKELADRVTLKEVPVNKGNVPINTSKFVLADGEFPKLQVELYEQMVYHRSTSINMKPLKILVPSRYKINHSKIIQYFKDKESDVSVRKLVTDVVEEYGNNNSLFYKHTISGKSNASGLDLDKKKHDSIEMQIEKWHNDYAGWIFYDNASTFFLQNREIPKDELITLRMELIDIFDDGTTTNGIDKFVDEITEKYNELIKIYDNNGANAIEFFKNTLSPYITFFNIVFNNIKQHLNDQLNFVTNRKENMGSSYDFNDTIKASIFKTYEDIKMILDNNFESISNVSLLNILSVVNVFKTQIFELNKKFPLKNVFDDYILNQKKIIRSNMVYSRSNIDNIYNVNEVNEEINKIDDSNSNTTTEFDNFKREYVIFKIRQIQPEPQLTTFGFQNDSIDLDILFYILYRATNNVVYAIMKQPTIFENLDEVKNPELRKIQQEVEMKEKKNEKYM